MHLQDFFTYDEHSGSLKWSTRPESSFSSPGAAARWNGLYADKEAGNKRSRAGKPIGIYVSVERRIIAVHHVIWAIKTGNLPIGHLVDHADGNAWNNAWKNLRKASRSENNRNRAVNSKSASGYKGVWFNGVNRTWRAYIYIGDYRKWLGSFKTPEAAAIRYNIEAIKLHGDFARPNTIKATLP